MLLSALLVSLVLLLVVVPRCRAEEPACLSEPGFLLSSGRRLPRLGLGTAGLTRPIPMAQLVGTALHAGYRLIDTADLYYNHRALANALATTLPSLGLTREDIFLTTKLRPTDLGATRCRYAVRRMLEELHTDYLDLLLIHAPTVPPVLGMAPSQVEQKELRAETWRCLQDFHRKGVLRSIGVSNYDATLLQEVAALGGPGPQVLPCHYHHLLLHAACR
jgi:diketogulonate reductase-like aldo/keto reductase